MKCFLVSLNPEQFIAFQKRLSFLSGCSWIKNIQELERELLNFSGVALFLVDFKGRRDVLDELVMQIREKITQSKIMYVMDDGAVRDLKAHQMTPAGGDAYISSKIDPKALQELIFGFESTDKNFRNKFETNGDALSIKNFSDLRALEQIKNHPLSQSIDEIFKENLKSKKPKWQSANELSSAPKAASGVSMSDKDQELTLDNLGDLEIIEEHKLEEAQNQEGLDELDLNLDDLDLSLSSEEDNIKEETIENLGMLDFDLSEVTDEPKSSTSSELKINLDSNDDLDFSLSEDQSSEHEAEASPSSRGAADLSQDAIDKLKEIDAIMELDASQVNINHNLAIPKEDDLDQPLVSDDIDLDNIDFGSQEEAPPEIEEKPKRKKKEKEEARSLGMDLKEISGAYTGEMERAGATISNLRADREELLNKIQEMEDRNIMHNRQVLSLRAELDEKKIELSIIRKKLNEEITDLRDKLKVFDEKKLILEEKNRILQQELDKAGQKNKIDVKKVLMRERELEQKLELLKTDAEMQIRNRDLKILELKRKVDAMEFDMESISTQEKRSIESRYELEDKLDKAIKTLRNAITVLEDETDKGNALEALKKNIEM